MHFVRYSVGLLSTLATLALGCAAQRAGDAPVREPSVQAVEAGTFPEPGAALSDEQSAEHSASAAVDLCALQVEGAAAAIHEQDDTLVVLLTAADAPTIHELQRRAARLAAVENGPAPAVLRSTALVDEAGPSAAVPVRLQVTTYDVPVGVVIVIQSSEAHLAVLRAQLEKNVQQIRNARC
jgi:hypothetical protein